MGASQPLELCTRRRCVAGSLQWLGTESETCEFLEPPHYMNSNVFLASLCSTLTLSPRLSPALPSFPRLPRRSCCECVWRALRGACCRFPSLGTQGKCQAPTNAWLRRSLWLRLCLGFLPSTDAPCSAGQSSLGPRSLAQGLVTMPGSCACLAPCSETCLSSNTCLYHLMSSVLAAPPSSKPHLDSNSSLSYF